MTTNILYATITAYCACTHCCGPKATGITAAGTKVSPAHTIALPRRFPLGAKVVIMGHTYTGEDRTAKRYDGRFDIYFASHRKAKEFGIRTNKVTIITK